MKWGSSSSITIVEEGRIVEEEEGREWSSIVRGGMVMSWMNFEIF